MFGISLSEFSLIVLLLLILFKPKDIIILIQKVISYYENFKHEIEEIKSQIILLEEDKFIKQDVVNEFEIDDSDQNPDK